MKEENLLSRVSSRVHDPRKLEPTIKYNLSKGRMFRKKQSPAKNFEKPNCLDNIQLDPNLRGNVQCKGIALIASNNYEGTGYKHLPCTDEDSKNMKAFFSTLENYEVVTPKKNLRANEFMNICERLASLQYPETYKRLVIYFAGHGGNGYITMIDERVRVEQLQAIFDPGKNKTLDDMAKIFIIDACRGSGDARGGSDKSAKPYQAQCRYSNQLMVYSTLEGHVAHSDEEGYGGVWTYAFYKCLVCKDYMHKHLCDVLAHVNGKLGLQTSSYQSSLSDSHFIYFWIEAGTCSRKSGKSVL